MKHINFKSLALLSLLTVSVLCFGQKKEKVTITGKITVKDTGKPPVGIITVNEKGVADYMVMGDIIGTNRHTFVEKDGSFKFTINKGGTIVIQDGGNRYRALVLENLNKSQTINLKLDITQRTSPKPYPVNTLTAYEKGFDIHKRVKVSGKVIDAENKPIDNASVFQTNVYTENIPSMTAFTLSDKKGEFEYVVQKGARVGFGSPGLEYKFYTVHSDTVINTTLLRNNPFK